MPLWTRSRTSGTEARSGELSLALVGTLVDSRIAALLRAFARQAGQVSLDVRTATSAEVSQLVRRGEVALGLRYFAEESPDLVALTVGEESMVVVASADHPVAKRPPQTVRQLERVRWIGFPASRTPAESFGRVLVRQLGVAGLADAEIMRVDSLSAQKRLVEAGFGLALLPESSVTEELKAGTLKILHEPGLSTTIPVTIVHRRRGYLSPAARALLDLVTDAWAQTGGRKRAGRPPAGKGRHRLI